MQRIIRVFSLILLALVVPASALADEGKLETIGAFAGAGGSEALKKALEPKGYRVTTGGSVLCEIWLSSSVTTGKNDAQGASYTWLPESSLIAVITFPAPVDPDPTVKFKFEELTTISKKTTGSNHPSPLSLVSTDGISTWPSVFEDENRHLVFAAKVKTNGGSESPIAFVVKGVAEQ